jgi:hypothetical protein
MNRFHCIATSVAGVALVFSTATHAESWFNFEAGIGGAAYQSGPDGLWLQQGFEHKLNLSAPAIEAGFTGNILQRPSWGLDWHLDYVWLATIHTQGKAVPDANYNLQTKTCNGPCLPFANFTGSGHDQGFMLTLEPHYDYRGFRFGVEAWPYLHRSTWSADATNQVDFFGQTPRSTHFEHDPKWQLGAVVGASVGYKNFALKYQYLLNRRSSSDPTPQIWNGVHVLMLSVNTNGLL